MKRCSHYQRSPEIRAGGWWRRWMPFPAVAAIGAGVLLLAGCTAPIGADRVTTRQAYAQVETDALSDGQPSASTVSLLHRFQLDERAARHPDEVVRELHQRALDMGDRELLFALAEMSYVAGDRIRRAVQPWDPRDARDYYLGSAVYAWLFLFGEGSGEPPSAFDRRFRQACNFYNAGLGLAFTEPGGTNAVVNWKVGRRRLPVGELEIRLDPGEQASLWEGLEKVLLADQFRVHGLSVRIREPGVGTPLICVSPVDPGLGFRVATPATMFLRVSSSLAEITAGRGDASLQLHATLDRTMVDIGNAKVPLEIDLTTYRAYNLNQATIWKLGSLQFLAPAERISSKLLLHQPYDPERIPLVFVHGTFSSPVTWAEMANTLTADPVLRRRYQMWSFIYGSGNPLIYSIADLRAALAERIANLDPDGTNEALRQMVVIGHSQGGLLTKATAMDSGDEIWRRFSNHRVEDLDIDEDRRAEIRRLFFLEPLPFVRRVVFIATPHRGSYMSGNVARRLAQHLVTLPSTLMSGTAKLLLLADGTELGEFMHGRVPTSLDGMSPKNPGLMAMADIPVAPSVKAHSIIPVLDDRDLPNARDGVVTYESAHVKYVESELIVHNSHTCLENPATIEEVRRILHEHLDSPP